MGRRVRAGCALSTVTDHNPRAVGLPPSRQAHIVVERSDEPPCLTPGVEHGHFAVAHYGFASGCDLGVLDQVGARNEQHVSAPFGQSGTSCGDRTSCIPTVVAPRVRSSSITANGSDAVREISDIHTFLDTYGIGTACHAHQPLPPPFTLPASCVRCTCRGGL
jgi:hypothetical protein